MIKDSLNTDGFIAALNKGQRPAVGLDTAVNKDKGLRLVARVDDGLWEQKLCVKPEMRLKRDWPYLDLPILNLGQLALSAQVAALQTAFCLNSQNATALLRCLTTASLVAVDSPRSLSTGPARRTSEATWHNLIIAGVKENVGGIFWAPFAGDLAQALAAYFSDKPADRCTTTQIQLIAGSQWMFVGFWVYDELRSIGCPFIEYYPEAARKVFCEIAQTPAKATRLVHLCQQWNKSFPFDNLCRKSDSNDAAMGSFLSFLHLMQRTEELAPNEIVIPCRAANPCW